MRPVSLRAGSLDLTSTSPRSTSNWGSDQPVKLILQDVRRLRFWKRLGLQAFSMLGLLALVLGLIDVLFPDALPGHGRDLGVAVLAASAIYGVIRAWPRPIEQSYSSPNITIRLVEGDLFA